MNLQRREEIRELIVKLEAVFPPTDFEMLALSAINELFAHIDALEQVAAERVIDSGRIEAAEALAERLGKTIERLALGIKPSSADRCAARWATSSATDRSSFERGWEAREAEGMEAPAVVVNRDCGSCASYQDARGDSTRCDGCGGDEMPNWNPSRSLAGIRATSADRALGDGAIASRWIPVSESLPEDGESIGFITECRRDDFYNARVYGGRFNRSDWDNGFGGFNTHGLGTQASHWCKLPPIPDALRANQGGTAT